MGISIHPNAQASSEFQAVGSGAGYNVKIFKANENHSMSCGVFVINKADITTFEYPCSEYTIVLEGEFRLEDEEKPGEAITLKAGDVARIDKGTKAKWSSPSTGKGFYVTDREVPDTETGDLKKYIV